jgi:hypothetical protein
MLLAFNNQFYDPHHLWKVTKVKEARFGPEGSRRFRLPDFMTFGTRRW